MSFQVLINSLNSNSNYFNTFSQNLNTLGTSFILILWQLILSFQIYVTFILKKLTYSHKLFNNITLLWYFFLKFYHRAIIGESKLRTINYLDFNFCWSYCTSFTKNDSSMPWLISTNLYTVVSIKRRKLHFDFENVRGCSSRASGH